MEFQLENYKLRLLKDGIIERWYEFKNGKQFWKELKFSKDTGGYLRANFCFTNNSKLIAVKHHRLVYYAHNQDWDIWDKNQEIDHANRIRDDNRIENLSVATRTQNNRNTNKKGYCWDTQSNKYKVQIRVDNKQIHIGYYKTEEEAIKARADAEAKYWV